MRSNSKFKKNVIVVTAQLISMLCLGALLVGLQTYLVKLGYIPLDRNLNVVTHFLMVAVVGTAAGTIARGQGTLNTVIATGILYILLLAVSGVICDGPGSAFGYGIFGGVAGCGISLITSITQRKRSANWRTKKYRC